MVTGISDGTIDIIVSDHAPHDQDSKRLPFSQAANGIIGLETMLPLALEIYHNGHIGLHELLAKMTINPANLVGLQAGQLRIGAPADLTLIDLNYPWQIKVDKLHSKSHNAPYDGRPVQGRALKTWVNGRIAFDIEMED